MLKMASCILCLIIHFRHNTHQLLIYYKWELYLFGKISPIWMCLFAMDNVDIWSVPKRTVVVVDHQRHICNENVHTRAVSFTAVCLSRRSNENAIRFFLLSFVHKRSTFYALSIRISSNGGISFASPLHSGRCAIGDRQSNGNGQIEFRLHWLDAYLSVIMGPEFNSLLSLLLLQFFPHFTRFAKCAYWVCIENIQHQSYLWLSLFAIPSMFRALLLEWVWKQIAYSST